MLFSRLRAPSRAVFGALCASAMLVAPATNAAHASADIKLDARSGQKVLPANRSQHIYLRISLAGVPLETGERRTPVNVALVLDRSGSMQGLKIEQAKEAAVMALNRLGATDIASVVAYNHNVTTLVPARRLKRRGKIEDRIRAMQAAGKTALYAGVKQGLREVGKHRASDRVNRVILLSDGLANVGPSSPQDVAVLGSRAARAGVTVSTIGLGLGYNEDLMARLSGASDGNHAFVENADDLVDIFNREFGDVLSVVAQDVIITIECRAGFRPIRALGRDAEISGRTVKLKLNQVYGGQDKYLLIEVEVPSEQAVVGTADIASVDISYNSMRTNERSSVSGTVDVRFSASQDEAEASIDKEVMTEVTTQIATTTSEEAVKRRDQGDVDGARKLLRDNAAYLKKKSKELNAPLLGALGEKSLESADSLTGSAWTKNRKAMRARQYKSKNQQSY